MLEKLTVPSDRQPVVADGLLIIDKPAGITSHDVVARVRKILRTRRVGHTGTLDPFATGVLVVCVNQATRLAQFLTSDEKEYLATVRLGYATDTGDFTGTRVTEQQDAQPVSRKSFIATLSHFRGRLQQFPPMYSAKKVGGVKLYEMARRGETIERQPIEIEIRELELIALNEVKGDLPDITFQDAVIRVTCSSGTYIRTLAEDIGRHLSIGAHLTALRRTRAGQCHIREAITLEQLNKLAESGATTSLMIPMSAALDFPERILTDEELSRVVHGNVIRTADNYSHGQRVKLCDSFGQLLAIGEFDQHRGALQPRIVLFQ